MSAYLRKRLLEAEETLSHEISSTSVVDACKENLNHLTDVVEDAGRNVRTCAPSECSRSGTITIEADYLKREECALEELQAAATVEYSASRPREVRPSPGKHFLGIAPLQGRDTVSNGSAVQQAIQEVTGQDGLERKLCFFQEVFQSLLWSKISQKHGLHTAAESEGASSDEMKSLKEQVEKVGTAIHCDILEAHYREQVASARSQHKALMAVVDKLEEQNSRLTCLETMQRRHRDTVEKVHGTMTDAYEVLNSSKGKYVLMLSHLEEAKGKQATKPVPFCDWRWEDNGAEFEAHLNHFQKNLLGFADAVEVEDADETSRRRSLTKAFHDTKKGGKEDVERALPFLEQIKALQQLRQKRIEKFKSRAFAYFYLRPEEFAKKAAQFSAK